MCTRQKSLVTMSEWQPMKTSTLIIHLVLLGNVLDSVYGLNVDVFKNYIVIHVVEIYTYLMMYGRWYFSSLRFYHKVSLLINVSPKVIHSHKLLAIFTQVFKIAYEYQPLDLYFSSTFCTVFICTLWWYILQNWDWFLHQNNHQFD